MKKPLVKKENLDRLLTLLPHLLKAEGNEWFKSEVKKIVRESEVEVKEGKDTLHVYSELGDQYLISPALLLIDYSDIPDKVVREKLNADCFEMARCRLGRGNHAHTPDFDEYCRHAHLQIEELINYYYQKKFDDNIEEIKKDILSFNKFALGKIESTKELSWVSFIYKMWAVINKFGLGKDAKNIMPKLAKLRNDLSHRTSLTKKKDEQIFEEYEKKNGLFRDMDPSVAHPDEINLILFRKEARWDDVVAVITKLKDKIVQEL